MKCNVLPTLGGTLLLVLASSSVHAGRCLPGGPACAVEPAPVAAAAVGEGDATARHDAAVAIAPPGSTPQGQSYGHWAADWWQWVLGIPAAKNPLLDADGSHCGERQVGRVWFLAGSAGAGSVTRSCTVLAGKALFFPLINNFYGAFLNDPPATSTEAAVRRAARCTEPARIAVWIDGQRIEQPWRYFTGGAAGPSPTFNVQLPPGNLLGDESTIPELALSPAAEQGYYLFVRPLPRGEHVIRWKASGCTANNVQDVTYHLRVV